MNPITLRTRSGIATGSALLVAWISQSYRPTHNGDGRYARCIGVDADRVAYQTRSSGGWRRVDGVRADEIRSQLR